MDRDLWKPTLSVWGNTHIDTDNARLLWNPMRKKEEAEEKMSTNVLKASAAQSLILDRDYRRSECRYCFHCAFSDKLAMCDGWGGKSGPLPIQLPWNTCHQMDPRVNLNKEKKEEYNSSISSPPSGCLILLLTVSSNPVLFWFVEFSMVGWKTELLVWRAKNIRTVLKSCLLF